MAKDRGARRDGGAATLKQTRRKLRKAESRLAAAQQKRDRAQARVEALAIIADEIRATMAEVDRAETASRTSKAEEPATPQQTPEAPAAPKRPRSSAGTRQASASAGARRASASAGTGRPRRTTARTRRPNAEPGSAQGSSGDH